MFDLCKGIDSCERELNFGAVVKLRRGCASPAPAVHDSNCFLACQAPLVGLTGNWFNLLWVEERLK